MAASDILTFIAPEFTDAGLITLALAMAEQHRPWCLSEDQGDEAVALYAAWLLSVRGGQSAGSPPAGPLIREREGDRERAWASPSTFVAPASDYKVRYDALARLCGFGSILTRDVAVPGVLP